MILFFLFLLMFLSPLAVLVFGVFSWKTDLVLRFQSCISVVIRRRKQTPDLICQLHFRCFDLRSVFLKTCNENCAFLPGYRIDVYHA